MNCAEFQTQLDAWLDGELDDATSRTFEAHVATCADCAATAEASRQESELWRDALQASPAAARVAQRARQRLVAVRPPTAANFSRAAWRWLTPLLTFAAGFLLAVVTVPRWSTREPNEQRSVVAAPPAFEAPMVAHLVTATGPVEQFDAERREWVAINPQVPFACPSDSRLRTQPDVRCELRTGNGSVIRLNDRTEVTLLGSSSIQLQQGQLWCRSPQDVTLEVRVAASGKAGAGDTIARSLPTTGIGETSCLFACVEDAGIVRVVNNRGEVQLQTAAGKESLAPGQVAEIANGQRAKSGRDVDRLLTMGWMDALLAAHGPDNVELRERVDGLLARIGQSKVSNLYEQEIRELGEYAVLPLVRYIQSPLSHDDPVRRRLAMLLTADLAPVWLIPELVELLADHDPEVRPRAAATLLRLTGLTMGGAPNAWREEPNETHVQAVSEWRAWWQEHRGQYPTPRVRVLGESAMRGKVM